MGTRPDPQSHTWTAEALSAILQTPTKRLTCKCSDDSIILISESLLCYFSRYYLALLRGSFAEAGSNSITLELNASQAKAFVTWMYSGQFAESLQYTMPFDLHVFADKVDVPAKKKSIMTFIHKCSHRRGNPDLADAVRAFHKLPKSCGLVRWMLDRFAHHEEPGFRLDSKQEFAVHVTAAQKTSYMYRCIRTGFSQCADPCCNVVEKFRCDCCERCQSGERTKKGQACAYHEHTTVKEWKGK